MRSPLSYILCTAAICLAILGMHVWVPIALTAALVTEWIAVPRPPV